jgi:hypothetical protein
MLLFEKVGQPRLSDVPEGQRRWGVATYETCAIIIKLNLQSPCGHQLLRRSRVGPAIRVVG